METVNMIARILIDTFNVKETTVRRMPRERNVFELVVEEKRTQTVNDAINDLSTIRRAFPCFEYEIDSVNISRRKVYARITPTA